LWLCNLTKEPSLNSWWDGQSWIISTALRAGITLDCADGLSTKAVAANRKVTVHTVCMWRVRFFHGQL
jgi:hypothetical protein